MLVRFLLSCWFSHLFIYKASPLPAYPCSSKKRTACGRPEKGSRKTSKGTRRPKTPTDGDCYPSLHWSPDAHYLNCAKWGSVSRARYFFTAFSTIVMPLPSSSPFEDGWSPALIIEPDSTDNLKIRPLPPWLRPRRLTDRGSVVQSPLAYHPKNLPYDVSYFGTQSEFQTALTSNLPHLFPTLPFKQFLPEFLWSDWDHLVAWGATFDSTMTPAIINAVSNLQDFFDNPFYLYPLPSPNPARKSHRFGAFRPHHIDHY